MHQRTADLSECFEVHFNMESELVQVTFLCTNS